MNENNKIILKNARMIDWQDYLRLIILSDCGLYDDLFGNKKEELFKYMFIRENNHFSYNHSNMIYFNDKLVGLLHGFSGGEEAKERIKTGLLMLSFFRFKFFNILNNLKIAQTLTDTLEKQDFYLSNFAIYPEYRGIGIGSIAHAVFEEKLRKKFKRIILDVNKENEKAIKFYKDNGYKIIDKEQKIIFNNIFYKMEKFL